MAIGGGGTAWGDNNATTATVPLGTHLAGDLLIVIAACKAAAIASVDPTIATTGWTRVASFADGTTNAGNGVGSVRCAVFYKIATSAAETSPVVTWGGGQTAAPGIVTSSRWTESTGGRTWVVPVVVQAATTNATSISVTMGSDPGLIALDVGLAVHTTRDDSALSATTWTATGTTLGAASDVHGTFATPTSNDMAGHAVRRPVTSGTSSAAPVVTGTQAAAETGVTTFIRLRTEASATPVTGTGAGAGTAQTAAGTAAETFVGTGGGTGTAASASGSGTSLQEFTGTGAGTQAAASATGSGLEEITGTGAGDQAIGTAEGAGSALVAVTGSGAGVGAAATAEGSGDVATLGEITGSGAGEQLAASATGEALQVFPGGGVQVPQSAYGEGTVEGGVEVPPGEGSSLYAPRLRLVIGGRGAGTQARQSAHGTGLVNDDDLVVMAA